MANSHAELPDAGRIPHSEIDDLLQSLRTKPIAITGARDVPEQALANLLTALEKLGLIMNSTSAS